MMRASEYDALEQWQRARDMLNRCGLWHLSVEDAARAVIFYHCGDHDAADALIKASAEFEADIAAAQSRHPAYRGRGDRP